MDLSFNLIKGLDLIIIPSTGWHFLVIFEFVFKLIS